MGKIIQFPGKRRSKSQVDQPERFSSRDLQRGRREDHTQERYVPEAMNLTLTTKERWKPAKPRAGSKGGRVRRRSPSTLQLNNSNVKRKSKARGRTK